MVSLKQETLHITVTLFDRILVKHQVPSNRLKLLGITCLFIATKFEDIVTPTAQMLCHIGLPQKVGVNDIYMLELKILSSLNFDVQYPTSYQFFELFCNLVKATNIHRSFGQFILEITLLERPMILNKKPSLIAFGAAYLVCNRMVKSEPRSRRSKQILDDLVQLLNRQAIYPFEIID